MGAKSTDIAWAAGFIDGEGCITIQRDSGRACLYVGQKGEAPLLRLKEIFDTGLITQPHPKTGVQMWQVRNKVALEPILTSLMPHLTVKKRHAKLALEFCSLVTSGYPRVQISDADRQRREEIADEISSINGNQGGYRR